MPTNCKINMITTYLINSITISLPHTWFINSCYKQTKQAQTVNYQVHRGFLYDGQMLQSGDRPAHLLMVPISGHINNIQYKTFVDFVSVELIYDFNWQHTDKQNPKT